MAVYVNGHLSQIKHEEGKSKWELRTKVVNSSDDLKESICRLYWCLVGSVGYAMDALSSVSSNRFPFSWVESGLETESVFSKSKSVCLIEWL